MLWKNRRESGNVVDRRGMGGGALSIGGLLVGAVFYYMMGGNPLEYIASNANQVSAPQQRQEVRTRDDDDKRFVSVVLADTEDVWNEIFKSNNQTYQEPKLVLFTDVANSACGRASSAVGPFYCPEDHKLYLDLGFFKELSNKLNANGDFAEAYVIAHEVGHHVQNLLGVESFKRGQSLHNQTEKNHNSVQVELQADCFAGVWAKHTESNNVLEQGDLEEAMNAASAVGDDRLQEASRGVAVPDSFTHGSSNQRVSAFKTGLRQGNPQDCLDSYR